MLGVDAGVLFRPYSSLSGGEQVKVLLAALFLREGAFLLLDEPTNHLDLEGRRVVSRSLSRKSGFLLVSHDRVFLDGCVDHIMVINKRDIEVRQGSFSAWWRDKQARDDWERAENARLKREIGRLEDAARRTASWSDRVEAAKKGCRNSGLRPDRGYLGHKAQKMMRRSKAVEARRTEAAEAKAGLLKNIELAEALKLRPLEHPKRCLLEARELAPDYGAGPCAVLSPSPWSGGNGWLWWGGTALESPACSGWRWVRRSPTRDFSPLPRVWSSPTCPRTPPSCGAA